MKPRIAIRCDVDFAIGLSRGVPFLMRELDRRGIKITFLVTMGPDGFGRNVERLSSKGYFKRIRRMNIPSMLVKFGPAYLAKNLAGLEQNVGLGNSDMMKMILDNGHELGIHGWDHYWWAENVWQVDEAALIQDTLQAKVAFQEIIGTGPLTSGAPNWRVSVPYLKLADQLGFEYFADTRGFYPYYPRNGNWTAKTLQVPFNLPCLHEISNYINSVNQLDIEREFLRNLDSTFNVWCIHDYYEGILQRELFIDLLDRLLLMGYEFCGIKEYLDILDPTKFMPRDISKFQVAGGRGQVSYVKAL
jgi:undecaprenyl phosphate-alpha-L-ara4FN deformylase